MTTLRMLKSFSQRAFYWPSEIKARLQRLIGQPDQGCPFTNSTRLSTERQIVVAARIVVLFCACRPAAIARFVVAVVVRVAINGMRFGWARTHVSIESREVLAPCSTNCDTPRSVLLKRVAGRIVTASFHGLPNPVLRRLRFIVRPCRRRQLTRQTSTASRSASAQRRPCYDGRVSAVASAYPCPLIVLNDVTLGHYQPPITTAHDVFSYTRHGSIVPIPRAA